MQWPDVDLDRGQLHIKAVDAKSGRERWLPLSHDMVARLRVLQTTSTSPYLFAGQRGGPVTHSKHRYWKAVRAAGLAGTGVDIHCLRHTFATRFYEATGDLLLLQRLGGWSSLTLVQRYAHARMERAGEAIRAMVSPGT